MKMIVHFLCVIITGIGVANAQVAPVRVPLNKKQVDVGKVNTIIELVRSTSTPQQVKIFYDSSVRKADCLSYADSKPYWVSQSCINYGGNLQCTPGHFTTSEYCDRYSEPYTVSVVKSIRFDFKKAKKLASQETEKIFLSISPGNMKDEFNFFGVDLLQYDHTIEGGSLLKKLSVEFKYNPKVLPHILPQTIAVLQGRNEVSGAYYTVFQQKDENISVYRMYNCYDNCPYIYLPLTTVAEYTQFMDKRYERTSNMSKELLKSKLLSTLNRVKLTSYEPLTSEEYASLSLTELSKLEMFEALKEQKELLAYVAKNGSDSSTDYRLKQLEIKIKRSELKALGLKKAMAEIDSFIEKFDSPDLEVVMSGIVKELIFQTAF